MADLVETDGEQPRRDQIAEWLREAIIGGRLMPGQRVRENEVAQRHHVSRVPVREAVHRLAAEGFLELVPYRGATVATPSKQFLGELLQVRQALEAAAAGAAAEQRGGAFADRLVAIAEAGNRALVSYDYAAIPSLVEEFHQTVAEASGNREMVRILVTVRDKIRWMFAKDLLGRSPSAWREHSLIVEAILAGDSANAARLMTQHIARDATVYEGIALP